MRDIKKGKYKHFRGKEYELISVARDSETLTEVVIYKALYGEGDMWVRPLAMFEETIEREGKKIRRFEYIGEE